MEIISMKLEKNMLYNMDKSTTKHNFSTRTEFIRAAIREKLENLSRDELIDEFLKTAGSIRKKTDNKKLKEIRKEVSKELLTQLDKKFK